jgi:hypothetical protein
MSDFVLFNQSQAQRIGETVRDSEARRRGQRGGFQWRPQPVLPHGTRFTWTDSGAGDLPAFGVFQQAGGSIDADSGTWPILGEKAAAGGGAPYWVNRSNAVAYNERGIADQGIEAPVRVLYDDSGPTPAAGQIWGPKDGSFALWPDLPGFLILDVDAASGTVLALAAAGGDLRPFELTAGHVPQAYSTGTPKTAAGVFLDDPAGYGNEAAQTLYWEGGDQTSGAGIKTPPICLGLGRARNITSGNQIPGTRGWARWNPTGETVSGDPNYPTPGRWEIVCGDFEMHTQAVIGSYAIHNGWLGTARLWWWDATGSPQMRDSTHDINLTNICGRWLAPGEAVNIYYDCTQDRWFCAETTSNLIRAKVQTGYVNFPAGAPAGEVSLKMLDASDNEIGDAFTGYMKYDLSRAPCIFPADTVLVEYCPTKNRWYLVGEFCSDGLGMPKIFTGGVGGIPPGFKQSDYLKGYVPVGLDTDSTTGEETLDGTFGFKKHGTDENGHPDHPNHRHELDGTTYDDVGPVAQANDIVNDLANPPAQIGVVVPTSQGVMGIQGGVNPTAPWTTGDAKLAGGANVDWTHKGTAFGGVEDTDNRQPSKVVLWIERDETV